MLGARCYVREQRPGCALPVYAPHMRASRLSRRVCVGPLHGAAPPLCGEPLRSAAKRITIRRSRVYAQL